MRFLRMQSILLALAIGLGGLFISLALLAITSPVLAQASELDETVSVSQAPPEDDWTFIVVFTDPANIPITDLSGNLIGDGKHEGKVRCNSKTCNQKTELQMIVPLSDLVYTYKFSTRLAVDPEARSVVVGGTGTITRNGQKERFSFTATFQDNRDGTLSASYEASRPDAGFVVPSTSGTFAIVSGP